MSKQMVMRCWLVFLGLVSLERSGLAAKKNPLVSLETTRGKIVLELFADKAPKSTENFISYVRAGHYNGLIFHRVISDFMIQGGGFDSTFKERATHAPIKNEADNGLLNRRGTLAMARTSEVDSATSQFFINTRDNSPLDHTAQSFGYAVFGRVKEGMSVVDAIRHAPTRCPSYLGQPCHENLPPGMMDVPKETVRIVKARVL